jgi:DNA-directed RNA polymerase beta' subunit
MEVTRTTGKEWVVGITVPDGILRVRRNGRECWTGNSGRETGKYSGDEQPARGGEEGAQSKRIGGLDITALLSHGATDVIQDAQVIRGTRNEDYWNALKLGRSLPQPGVPFVYEKFISLLKAGGANVTRKGDVQLLSSLTDKDVDKMSNGEITRSDTVDAATLNPKPGGLFDEAITGGTTGKNWSHIDLAAPVINPATEEPIRRLLGMTGKEFRSALTAEKGGEDIRNRLADIQANIDDKIKFYHGEVTGTRGARRDNAVKCLRYLSAAKKQGMPLTDWVMTRVPVLPPIFRPVSKLGDMLMVADINDLYRDLLEVNNHIKEGRTHLPEAELAEAKGQLYDGVQAVMGWGEPITQEGRAKRLKGAIRQIIGEGPKWGLMQNKVLSKTVDLVARGTIAPDPDLDMDSVGIPADKAWQLYKPFVMRSLVRHGYPPVKAREIIEQQTKEAKAVLDQEMEARPVLLNRAPSWHKFNIMAFRPFITDEKVIRVSPLVTSGFNADFDGDAMNFHVPVSDKAVKQAWEKMLPSKNLFKTADLRTPMHMPAKEMLLGLYQMTRDPDPKQKPVVFNTAKEAEEAHAHGLIGYNDPIIIKEK